MKNKPLALALLLTLSAGAALAMPLQPLADRPGKQAVPGLPGKVWYVPSTVETIKWGYLPNAIDPPLLTVPSGATVVFDTLSHEGLLEDQLHKYTAATLPGPAKLGVGTMVVVDQTQALLKPNGSAFLGVLYRNNTPVSSANSVA